MVLAAHSFFFFLVLEVPLYTKMSVPLNICSHNEEIFIMSKGVCQMVPFMSA